VRLLIAFALLCVFSFTIAAPANDVQTEKIAFLQLTNGFWQLWIMNVDGMNPIQVTHSPVDKIHMAWGPANKELLYHTNQGETFILEIATGKERQILTELQIIDAAWSPDGKTLAYGLPPKALSRGKTSLWTSDLKGENLNKIAGDTKSDALAPMWSKGGDELVFRQCLMANNMQVYHDFWLTDEKGKNKQRVQGESEMLKFDQAISDHGIIAYSSARSGFFEIWVIPVAGGQPKQITEFNKYAGNPFWSANGQSIVFDSDKSGRQQIYLISENGQNIQQLTTSKNSSRKPVWSRSVTITEGTSP